jgi:hypothetical protein
VRILWLNTCGILPAVLRGLLQHPHFTPQTLYCPERLHMPKAAAWAGPGQGQAVSGGFGSAQVLSRPSQSRGFWAKPGRNITRTWGYSKRKYRKFPASSIEANLEKNLLDALGMVSLVSMRKYACRAQRFMHAYHEGLDGKDAAWACKKYRGHRVIPSFLLASLDKPCIDYSY